MSPRAVVVLGSNIQPEANLPRALARLADLGALAAVSSAYASPAVGPSGQPGFVNAAALIVTPLPPEEVRLRLRRLEAELGRVRTEDRYAPRPIDLDLVLYEDLVSEPLRLPDPDLTRRAYLAVVAPDQTHPVSGETLRTIADRLRPGTELTPRPDVVLQPGALP